MKTAADLSLVGFLPEKEVAALIGLAGAAWEIAKQRLSRHGFPQPDPINNLYYVPAVKAFFDNRHSLADAPAPSNPDGEEKWP